MFSEGPVDITIFITPALNRAERSLHYLKVSFKSAKPPPHTGLTSTLAGILAALSTAAEARTLLTAGW